MSSAVRFVFVLFAVVSASFPVKSQHLNLRLDQYNTDNGLSQNEVFDIVQDHQGFMWFATDEGLNRFDGHDFKIFRYEENNPHSVIGNSIQALEVDRHGTLWIGTTHGLSRYYPKTEVMEQLPFDFNVASLPNGTSVTDLIIHDDGSVWISYLGDGVDVYLPEKNEFRHYTGNDNHIYKIRSDYITALMFMPNGEKLFGSREGILAIDVNGIPMTEEETLANYPWKNKIDNSITCFRLSRDKQKLWIGTEVQGFYSVDLTTNDVQNYTTSNSALSFNNNVPALFEDTEGNLWIGGEAIHLLDQRTNTILPYSEQGYQRKATTKNPILSIYEDREKNIWFGSFRLGVLKYNPAHSQVEHYHSRLSENGLDNDQVLSFSDDDKKNIWIGTDGGGLYRLNPATYRLDHVVINKKISTQVIKCIYTDPKGVLWMGTWDNGLMRYVPSTDDLKEYKPGNKNFGSHHVWAIKPDAKGNLWLGTLRDGLCYFDLTNNTFKYFKNDPADSSSLVNDDVMCLMYDSEGSLWVGTSNGVSILKQGTSEFVNITAERLPTLNMNILTLFEDKQKRIWLGTNGGGLVIMDRSFNVLKVLNEKDGLKSSTICSLQPDDHDNLWVSTYNGLFRINTNDLGVYEIPQFIGLQSTEFIPCSYYKTKTGNLLFGGVNGFNFFHPDSLSFGRTEVNVVFTSLKISNSEVVPDSVYDGRKILSESIALAKEVNLGYEQYSFTLEFSPLLYTWQRNLHYAYMLEDLDKEWQLLATDLRTIHYTSLPPGDYTLKVKASFDGQTWLNNVSTLAIHIDPPWWGTWGFRIAAVALFIMGLITSYKLRVRYLTSRQRRLQELVGVRTAELEQTNYDLLQKNTQINQQNEEIQKLLSELAQQKDDIENKNHELSLINEQLSVQRDVLSLRGVELEKARERLQEINNNLEHLINRRTQKLNHTLRELETFLYRASHDLRGPISSMLGLLRVAALENSQHPIGAQHIEFFEKTILKLERTLKKLTQKHTIQKSKIVSERINKHAVTGLIDHITRNTEYFRPEDFELYVPDDFRFDTDVSMLNIILTNLLENAFFFTERSNNKKVMIHLTRENGSAIIRVKDNGPGIRHEIRDKIFTMFFRGHESATGNGLGLYLVRDALQKINGTITVETEEGLYSMFIVTLEELRHTEHVEEQSSENIS
jgi:ligand-binding sensor domain-containing protein/signal transduction histidine kinase